MYGWIHNCLKEAILNLCGEEKWNEICVKAGVVDAKVSTDDKTTYIDDTKHFALVHAALELLPHISEQDLYDIYGNYFISYLQQNGYEAYLLTFGDTLFELLNNMNKLHSHIATSSDKMVTPLINCQRCEEEEEEEDCFLLHYSSPRGTRLVCLLVGMVKSLARTYFSSEVSLQELVRQGDAAGSPCTVWKVKETKIPNSTPVLTSGVNAVVKPDALADRKKLDSLSLSADQFALLAPCHIVFNSDFEILQISDNMKHGQGSLMVGRPLPEQFRVSAAGVDGISGMTWGDFHTAALFCSDNQESFCFETKNQFSKSGKCYSYVGKILFLKNESGAAQAAVFLCSPNVDTLEEMYDQGVSIRDLKNKDDCRLQMLLNLANMKHFKDSSSEANEKLVEEVRTSEKAKGDLDAKRRLMMYISHEIRTPLSIVNFGFQLIKTQLNKLDILLEKEGVGRGVPLSAGSSRSTSPQPDPQSTVPSLRHPKCPFSSPDVTKSPPTPSELNKCPVMSTPPALKSKSPSSVPSPSMFLPGGVYLSEQESRQERHADIKSTITELDSITCDSAHSVEVAISILNDLLNYEKLQTNVLEMFKETVPCALVKSVIDEFHVEASYFKVRLRFKTKMSFEDLGNIFMCADKQKMSQVVRNFLSNALKFTPEGGSVVVTESLVPLAEGKEPEMKTSKEGIQFVSCGVLHVGVQDTGAGIAKENHGRVFHEMVQFSPNELQAGGGTGLGLFITRAIVNKHNGAVGFESEGLGHGCHFFFTIPVYRAVETVLPSGKSVAPTTSAASPLSPLLGRTILICDDSGLTRKMLKKVLLGLGCKHCYEAKNGLEAVKMIEDQISSVEVSSNLEALPAFDVILMDDHMPVLQGPEATRLIRELGFQNPIIGVTGNLASEEVDHFSASGADSVLSKPLDVSKLVNILQTHV